MTMRYVEVSLLDVEHEFQLARQQPRHLVPAPKGPSASSVTPDLTGLLGSLHTVQHILEMFRRTLPAGPARIAASSNASPIASPKSLPKPENSIHHRCGTFG